MSKHGQRRPGSQAREAAKAKARATAQPAKRKSRGRFADGDVLSERYRIDRFISRGGMGEVYEAEDMRLQIRVALKTVREKVASSRISIERFKREILLTRSVSHPNVCRIFDLGVHCVEGADLIFLTMELLDGESLADRIDRSGKLHGSEAAPIVCQIAAGLDAAHDVGVLHRDFKSSNILLVPTRRGERAVITDFGLALGLTEDTPDSPRMTATGTIVGTAAYMAPEYIRGGELAPTADIYSLGVVLYEMVTGVLPFTGESPLEIVAKRMESDPEPPGKLVPELEPKWEKVILRCLHRDPNARFGRAGDVVRALELPAAPVMISPPPDAVDHVSEGETITYAEDESSATAVARPTPGSGRRRGDVQGRTVRGRRVRSLALLAAAAVLALASWLILGRFRGKPLPTVSPRQITTSEGWEAEPSLSPDGTVVAFAAGGDDPADIWLVDTKGASRLQLTKDPASDRTPSWFPDSSAVAFASDRGGNWDLWKVPKLGGSVTPLVRNAMDPSISPDGRRIAFVRPNPSGQLRIATALLDNPEEVRFLTGDGDGLWFHRNPSWSPDGKTLCYNDVANLWLVPAEGGKPKALTNDNERDRGPTWSSDGKYVFFSSMREGTTALWRIQVAGPGRPERFTLGTGPEDQPSVSRDGRRLAYSTYVEALDVVVVDLETHRQTRLPGRRSDSNPAVAPDGSRVVFVSDRRGRPDLWIQSLESARPVGEPTRLTELPGSIALPSFSPDGRWIAVHRVFGGERDIWVMPSAGGMPYRITSAPGPDIQPAWSADGLRLAFVSERTGSNQIWAVGVEDGRASGAAWPVTSGAMECLFPAWLPDGEWIAFIGIVENGGEVFMVPASGKGAPRRITHSANASLVRAGPPGTLLVSGTWGGEHISLRKVALDTGDATLLDAGIDFGKSAKSGQFQVSADGRILAYIREEVQGDLWVTDAEAGSF